MNTKNSYTIQKQVISILLSLFFLSFVLSCLSPPQIAIEKEEKKLSRLICMKGLLEPRELSHFFMQENPHADAQKVWALANFYVKEAQDEGINSDIAFVQMCLETGFLRFGGLVSEDMNNFCGLGAISREEPGLRFPSMEIGVRAHIQHLQAYACTRDLQKELVDPRYKWVQPRGKSPSIYGLAGTWASDQAYGEKLDALLARLERLSFN